MQPASDDWATSEVNRFTPHRHRWALPYVTWWVAVRRNNRVQRLSPPAAIEVPGKERIRPSRSGEAFRVGYGHSTRLSNEQHDQVYE